MSNSSSNSFLDDLVNFTRLAKTDSNNLINLVKPILTPSQQQSIDSQLGTIEADTQKLAKGQLSYAEMRARYG